jgi:flagellar basal-body rod protein FlgF
MDRMLYIAMAGAKQNMLAQGVNTHNLANVSTTGFRADLELFRTFDVNGPGYDSRSYAVAESRGTDLKPGHLMATGRDLDVAVDGEGWITVVTPPDDREGYTRAGDFQVGPDNVLRTGGGREVMGLNGRIILPPHEKIDIGVDGTVSVLPRGQEAPNLVVIDRIKMVNPESFTMFKDTDGLMRIKGGDVATHDANVRLVSGMLESSNVNAVQAMVNMIAYARQFETNVKMMNIARENDQASSQLLRMS